jgi:hypothetical protein
MGMDEGRRNEVTRGNVFQPDVGVGGGVSVTLSAVYRGGVDTRLHEAVP